jgi:hypothetical protein
VVLFVVRHGYLWMKVWAWGWGWERISDCVTTVGLIAWIFYLQNTYDIVLSFYQHTIPLLVQIIN